ncbi:hypothetical protein SAMN02745166_03045 [Prosthecobacter debontii]|uniref:Uncharacterized protein n=1 Tax=Prosthecobacter debontii TaxID=48467 RepID=A0A1T4YDS9_9BACT|nr:hypothetical protein [Prosthecobacter debontii]SKA99843.1 hypothetical protein SAMN02745166_03045 [Prosthecobacter debontii]
METRLLDEATYRALLVAPMRNVTAEAQPQVDIWPYVAAVPAADLQGHEVWKGYVECIYRPATDAYDLVHVCTRRPNVFLVIVVDRLQPSVLGHHLLDLNKLYGG